MGEARWPARAVNPGSLQDATLADSATVLLRNGSHSRLFSKTGTGGGGRRRRDPGRSGAGRSGAGRERVSGRAGPDVVLFDRPEGGGDRSTDFDAAGGDNTGFDLSALGGSFQPVVPAVTEGESPNFSVAGRFAKHRAASRASTSMVWAPSRAAFSQYSKRSNP